MLHSLVLKNLNSAWSSTARWTDGSTVIWSYTVYSTKVVGLEATSPYDWKGWDACYHIDVALVLRGYNYKVVVCLRVYAFVNEMMSRLITKGIIRSYSMRRRGRIAAVKPNGIVSNCDVCGGLMFNAKRYMHMNDAYFAPPTIRVPYDSKKCIHFTLHWIWIRWIGYSSIALFRATASPLPPLPM